MSTATVTQNAPAPKPDKDGMLNVTVDDVTVTVDTNGMRDWRFVEASGAVEAGAAGGRRKKGGEEPEGGLEPQPQG